MKKKFTNQSKIGMVFLLLLLLSILADVTKEGALKDGYIDREAIGGEEKKLQLHVDMEDILEDYEYTLEVEPTAPTKEEAEDYFEKTIALIEQDFVSVGAEIPLKKEYFEGVVKADWSFQPFGIIDSEGKVYKEKLEKEESIIEAQVELTCGTYEKIYMFSFLLKLPKASKEEQMLQQIEDWIEQQMAMEGTDKIQLPTEIEGKPLVWSEEREYITPQILLLEGLAMILLWIVLKRKHSEDEKKKVSEMERDYPDVVNQLALLLGAGMTTRQAWNRLANQYSFKRKSGMIETRSVYEAILRMKRRFEEGESERSIYQQFLEEIPVPCFHKLMRILLGNLEKGTQGIVPRLEEESRLAFEQRIVQAKKRGEEASTKMLMPLMLMMLLVMGIVMVPALIEFQI